MFYVNDEPESKFLYTETIKLYCIVFPPSLISLVVSVDVKHRVYFSSTLRQRLINFVG